MTTKEFIALKPCPEAQEYVERCGSIQAAWDSCPRPDWLAWIISACNYPPSVLATFATDCSHRARIHAQAAPVPAPRRIATYATIADGKAIEAGKAATAISAALARQSAPGATPEAIADAILAEAAARYALHSATLATAAAAASSRSWEAGGYTLECQWQCDRLRHAVPVI